MKRSIREDLEAISDSLDHLKSRVGAMPLYEQVDVGAVLGAAIKSGDELFDLIKDEIKKHLKHETGDVNGEQFRAHLHVGTVHRLDQKGLKVGDPETYERWCKDGTQETVTFKIR